MYCMRESFLAKDLSGTHEMKREDTVRYTRAHERACFSKDLKMQGRNLKDFVSSTISQESVDRAEAYVRKAEGFFELMLSEKTQEEREKAERSKIIAECLEGIILCNKTWFGLMAQTYPTTKFDDVKNGIDMIVERGKDGVFSHEGVAMDVTYAGKNGIAKKIDRILENLRKGKMGTISFFKSQDGRYKGELNNLPLVVIGADFNTMSHMINLFAEDTPQANRGLAEHPFQFQMIEQVIMQCDFYISMIKTFDLDDEVASVMIDAYDRLAKTYRGLYKLKTEKTLPEADHNMRDKFHENMSSYLKHLSIISDSDKPSNEEQQVI